MLRPGRTSVGPDLGESWFPTTPSPPSVAAAPAGRLKNGPGGAEPISKDRNWRASGQALPCSARGGWVVPADSWEQDVNRRGRSLESRLRLPDLWGRRR